MLLPLLVCEDEERHCFSCHLMNQINLMVGTMYRLVKSGASGDYI